MIRTHRTVLARGIAAAVATAAATAAFAGWAPAAHAAASDPAQLAAGWLTTQLTDGDHMVNVSSYGTYDDPGLTADVVLALDAAGVGQTHAAAATTWLAGQVANYTGDGTTESYAGALAKLALVAQAQQLDPHDFGGSDLLARLLAQKDSAGRFSDVSAYGDYSNGIGQSLAILAFERAGSAPTDAVDFLVGTACANGGFPLSPTASPCVADTDTTGYAVQALLAAGRSSVATAALDWLVSVQHSGGGFGTTANANSTGLAVTALRVGGRDEPADQGVDYLKALQVGCDGDLADRSAIAYDNDGFAAGTAPRATAQAVLGLAGVGLSSVSKSGATSGFPTLTCNVDTGGTPPTTGGGTGVGGGSDGGSGTGGGTGSGSGAGVGGGSSGGSPTVPTTIPTLPATGADVGLYWLVGGLLVLSGGALLTTGHLGRGRAQA